MARLTTLQITQPKAGWRRGEATARDRLLAAIYESRPKRARRAAERLQRLLGDAALFDPDLEIAAGWLAEQRGVEERRRAQARRQTLKWVLTGAPLAAAALLTGLLAAVLFWSA